MSYTLFARLYGAIANGNNTEPETSEVFYNPPFTAYQNVTVYSRKTVSLDNGDTLTIALPAATAASWIAIMARVVGEAKLTTVGVNFDGVTAITGVTAGYGVEQYPGMISMVTTKVTSFTLQGLADGTTVEYIACILALDSAL